MATSRKHYELTAKLLRERFEVFRSYATCKRNVPVDACKREFGHVVIGLADIFAQDNRNFDRKKFYKECARLTEFEAILRDINNVEF